MRARTLMAWLAVAIGLGAAAWAQPEDSPNFRPPRFGGRHGPPPLDRVLERHADRLGIDADTRDAIRKISEASRAELREMRDALRKLHDDLRGELGKDAPDEAGVMDLADRIGAAETVKRKESLRTMMRIRALLTKEQRRELVEIHAEERAERRERRGPPCEHPGPRGPDPSR